MSELATVKIIEGKTVGSIASCRVEGCRTQPGGGALTYLFTAIVMVMQVIETALDP